VTSHPTDDSPRASADDQQEATESAPRKRRTGYWWIYLLVLLVGFQVAFLIPSPSAACLLVSLVLISLVVAAVDAELRPRDLAAAVQTFRNFVRGSPALSDRQRESIVIVFTVIACILMGLSALGFRPSSPNGVADGVFLMLAGGIAVLIAVTTARPLASIAVPTDEALAPQRSNWAVTALGVFLLMIVAEINGRALGFRFLQHISFHIQAFLFYGGVALVVWGLAGAPIPQFRLSQLTRIQKIEAALVSAIFLLALAVRAFGLDTTLRVSVDEAIGIPGIFHIWQPSGVGLVAPPSAYQTTLMFSYWQAILVHIFGRSLTGLRITSAFTGAFTVLALYLLARTLFDHPTAILAELLLATFPPHVHFSRIALLHIADPLFGTLAVAFIVRAIKYNRRIDWALAGAALGMTHYFFEAGRLFFTPLVVAWVALMILALRNHLKAQRRGLVVLALALLFTIMPAYYTLFVQGRTGTARLEDSGVSADYWTSRLAGGLTQEETGEIAYRLLFPLSVYVHQPETATYFYGGDQALVLESLVPLFLLGFFYLLWRMHPVSMVIVLWLLLGAGANALMRDEAIYARWVVAFPAVALVMAVGLRYVLPMLIPQVHQRLSVVPIAILAIVIAAAQVAYYFGPHLARLNVQVRDSGDTLDAALRSVEFLPGNTEIVIISTPAADANVPDAFLGFLLKDPDSMRLRTPDASEIDDAFFDMLPPTRNIAFFVEPGDNETLKRIAARYWLEPPKASPYDIPADKMFILYYAPVGSARNQPIIETEP